MKLYRFDDSERHHICARDEAEAITCFDSTYGDSFDPEHCSVTEVPQLKWSEILVQDEEYPQRMPATHYIGDPNDDRDAFLVCSTCY